MRRGSCAKQMCINGGQWGVGKAMLMMLRFFPKGLGAEQGGFESGKGLEAPEWALRMPVCLGGFLVEQD